MKISKIIKFTVLVFLVVLIFSVFRLVISPKFDNEPSSTPTPTSAPFSLERIFPSPGNESISDPNLALQFSFNKPIDTSTTVVTINPTTNFRLATDTTGQTLYISPISEWSYEVEYNVIIEARSVNNESAQPIEYSFVVSQMIDSLLTE